MASETRAEPKAPSMAEDLHNFYQNRETGLNPGTRKKRKSLEPMLISQLRDLANWFYIEGVSKKKLTKFPCAGGRNEVQVAAILTDLEKNNVVAIDLDVTYWLKGIEQPTLSEELRAAFDLRDAIVIDTTELIKSVNHDRKKRGLEELSSEDIDPQVHSALADATAEKVSQKLSSETHIAVGSGRAVYRFCEWLWRKKASAHSVLITPLTARIWAGNWQIGSVGLLEAPLDADDAAHLLALAFRHKENEAGARFSRFGYPIYTEKPSEARTILEKYSPLRADGTFERVKGVPGVVPETPRMAFVGVGVLANKSGHRIARYLTPQDTPTPIDPVRKEITAAMEIVAKNNLPAIGDIANRFFPVLPKPTALNKWSDAMFAKQFDNYEEKTRNGILRTLSSSA